MKFSWKKNEGEENNKTIFPFSVKHSTRPIFSPLFFQFKKVRAGCELQCKSVPFSRFSSLTAREKLKLLEQK